MLTTNSKMLPILQYSKSAIRPLGIKLHTFEMICAKLFSATLFERAKDLETI